MRQFAVRPLFLPILLLIGLAGCNRSGPAAQSPASSEAFYRAATLRRVTPADLDAAVAAHRGQVVLVDFWATWCGPCTELLPHTVELQKRHAAQGLAVIAVSMDEPDGRAAVEKFLSRHGGALEHYLSADGASAAAFEGFQIDNSSLPHLKLFDRQGKLLKTFGGSPLDKEDLDRAVAASVSQR